MDTLTQAAWLLAAMLRMVPPESAADTARPYLDPDAGTWRTETADERELRYHVIAVQTAAVVGEVADGDRYIAALAMAAFIHESRLDPDVDYGPCAPVQGRCPGGAVGLGQITMASWERTPEGWAKPDIAADREKMIRVAVRTIRGSLGRCGREQRGWATPKPSALLAGYTSGSCDEGHQASAEILGIGWRVLYAPPPRRAAAL